MASFVTLRDDESCDDDLRLELDDDDDFAVVKGDYASVVFQNLAEKYPIDAHIECKYTLTRTYEPHASDWIGLYKVGWSSVKDYKTYEYVKIPEPYKKHENNVAQVLFRATSLPGDDAEFYQFCYVGGGGVRGASVPFQFKRPSSEDFVEVEGDDELLIVRTKSAVLQESLEIAAKKERKLESEKKNLEAEKKMLRVKLEEIDRELEDKNDQVNDLEKLLEAREREMAEVAALLHQTREVEAELSIKVSDLEKAVAQRDERIVELKASGAESAAAAQDAQLEVSRLKEIKEADEVALGEMKETVKNLRSQIDELGGKTSGLEEEKELYKSHITVTEEHLRSTQTEQSSLKKILEEKESVVRRIKNESEAMMKEMIVLKEAIDVEKRRSEKLNVKVKDSEDLTLHLRDKLANASDRAEAAEQCKLMLDEQMKAYIAAFEGASKDLVDARGQIHDLKGQIKLKDKLLSEKAEMLAKLQSTFDDLELERDALVNKVTAFEEDRRLGLKEKEDLESSLNEVKLQLEELQSKEKETTTEAAPNSTEESASSDVDAALHALRIVNNHLEKRLDKKERQLKKFSSHAAVETELRKQVEDLKRRLVMGAEEYKKQYTECKKLQKKLMKMSKEGDEDDNCSAHPSKLGNVGAEADWQQKLEQLRDKKNRFKQLYQNELEKNKALQAEIEAMKSESRGGSSRCDVSIKRSISTSGSIDATVRSSAEATPTTTSPLFPSEEKEASSRILKPLPPPMIPVVLPTAKMAAVRAVNELPPSPKELEAALLASGATRAETSSVKATPTSGARRSTSRPTADAETGIAEEVVVDVCPEDREEFFLAPEPAPSAPPMPSSPPAQASAPSLQRPRSVTVPKEIEANLPSVGARGRDNQTEKTPFSCDKCEKVFSVEAEDSEIAAHLQEHLGRVCPVCNRTFPFGSDKDYQEFESHVMSHFDDEVADDGNAEPRQEASAPQDASFNEFDFV